MTPTREHLASPTETRCIVERVPCRCHNDRPTIDGEVGCARCIDSPFGPTWTARRVAAPPPEPQAMPPIEVGDIVTWDTGLCSSPNSQVEAARWSSTPHIAARVVGIQRGQVPFVWTREPRR